MDEIAVYVLRDPRENQSRFYVGSSVRPDHRFLQHMGAAKRGEVGRKADWIRELVELGLKPLLEIIAWLPEEKAAQMERDLFLRGQVEGSVLNEGLPTRKGLHLDMKEKEFVRRVGGPSTPGGKLAYITVPSEWKGQKVLIRLLD